MCLSRRLQAAIHLLAPLGPPAAAKGGAALQPLLQPHDLVPPRQEDKHSTHDLWPLRRRRIAAVRLLEGTLLRRHSSRRLADALCSAAPDGSREPEAAQSTREQHPVA
jgi:hypothetical protein